jgi:hypothetical protein
MEALSEKILLPVEQEEDDLEEKIIDADKNQLEAHKFYLYVPTSPDSSDFEIDL